MDHRQKAKPQGLRLSLSLSSETLQAHSQTNYALKIFAPSFPAGVEGIPRSTEVVLVAFQCESAASTAPEVSDSSVLSSAQLPRPEQRCFAFFLFEMEPRRQARISHTLETRNVHSFPVPAARRSLQQLPNSTADILCQDQRQCFKSRCSLTSFWRASMCGFHRRTSLAGAGGMGSAASTHQTAPAGPCRPPAWPQPWARGMNLGRGRRGEG